ncbi:MAG: hypothetical protein KGS48_14600 [Bacteroidetes bacterium]|nr:hypothetical protein [Bacteroidota bacterium]
MKPKFSISEAVYAQMLEGLNDLFRNDKLGNQLDWRFISDDYWLGDAAVIERIVRRKGIWEIELVFAHHKNPVQFISRVITHHSCPKRAAQIGQFMRRAAAKDQRGTLTVNIDELNLPHN